jgi:hypothetical protein
MSWLCWQQVGGLFGFLCHVLPWCFVTILVISISKEFYEEIPAQALEDFPPDLEAHSPAVN